jgi:peroxiredoxin
MNTNNLFINHRVAKNFIPLPPGRVPNVGDIAPDFSLPKVGGGIIHLSDYQGHQPVVLAFTRIFTEKLFCPYCYPHIKQLKEGYQKIRELGAELLMITSTDAWQSSEIVNNLDLPYPLLYDPDCNTFRSYQIGQALGAPLPAQFVLDNHGRITFRHLFSFIDGHASTDSILAQLEQLQ